MSMARTARRAAKKSNVVSVDFTGVETRKLLPEGEYVITVKEVTQENGKEFPYLSWKFEVDGATVYNNTSFNPKALWNMKSLLEALRYDLPEGPMDLDLDDLVGLECNATIEHEAYEGKKQMRLVDFWPMDDEAAEEEEKPAKKAKAAAPAEDEEEKPARKKKKAAEPKKFSQEEVNEMDSDELTDLLEKCNIDLDLSDLKTLRKQRSAVIDALEEAELLTEE